MSNDPLLQPYQLKHLTLKNRIMSTAHEPSYSEDGMPKDRYRLYHLEKAKGGIAMTMTAGSAIVAEDSPAAFGNLQAKFNEKFLGICDIGSLNSDIGQLFHSDHGFIHFNSPGDVGRRSRPASRLSLASCPAGQVP